MKTFNCREMNENISNCTKKKYIYILFVFFVQFEMFSFISRLVCLNHDLGHFIEHFPPHLFSV